MKNLMYVAFCLLIIGVASVGADADDTPDSNDCYELCDNKTKKWMVESQSAQTTMCTGTTSMGVAIEWPCPDTAWLYMEDCGCEVGGGVVEEGGEKCKEKVVVVREYRMKCPFSMLGQNNYKCERDTVTGEDDRRVREKICVDCP